MSQPLYEATSRMRTWKHIGKHQNRITDHQDNCEQCSAITLERCENQNLPVTLVSYFTRIWYCVDFTFSQVYEFSHHFSSPELLKCFFGIEGMYVCGRLPGLVSLVLVCSRTIRLMMTIMKYSLAASNVGNADSN